MPAPKKDPDKADEQPSRITGAQFLGGAWYAANGSPLTDAEAQQAHRAMDRAAAAARRKALRGGGK
jgi:hypothetical protein